MKTHTSPPFAFRAVGIRSEGAHRLALAADIDRFLNRDSTPLSQPSRPQAPPGSPIGEPAMQWLAATSPVCAWR